MGTHDLDKFCGEAPITYEAVPPQEIEFQALKQTKSMNAVQLFEEFEKDMKMKKFLHILEGEPRYPVFYDKNRQVLSLPPIINSEQTKISLETKNVFIEVTGTDLMKTKICLAIIAAQFSMHCSSENQFTCEQVKITYEGHPEKSELTPSLSYLDFEVELSYINRLLGLNLDQKTVAECLEKMGLNLLEDSNG